MNISLTQIKNQLNSENISFKLDINQEDLAISKLNYIYNAQANSLVYFTDVSIENYYLADVTLVCNKETDRNNKNINYIIVDDAKIAFYVLAQLFKENKYPAGIHSSAVIAKGVQIDKSAHIGANCVIQDQVIIGANSIIHPNTVIYSKSTIGKNVVIESNCSIGASGLFWTWDANSQMWQLPFRGGVIIEDDVFLGTDISIVRGCLDDDTTVIGSRTKIAHGTKIGHDCQIGDANHLANNVSLGGKVILKQRCFLGSGSIVKAGCTITTDTIIGAGAVVTKDFHEDQLILVGNPAKKMVSKKDRPSGMHAPHYLVKNK